MRNKNVKDGVYYSTVKLGPPSRGFSKDFDPTHLKVDADYPTSNGGHMHVCVDDDNGTILLNNGDVADIKRRYSESIIEAEDGQWAFDPKWMFAGNKKIIVAYPEKEGKALLAKLQEA